ncbi:MAG: hypothetical protein AAB490_00835 [Patescibacteria group bacterium]
MNNIEGNIEAHESSLGDLRARLQAVAESGDPHFKFISIEDLTDEDLRLYQKLFDDSLTEGDLTAHDAAHARETTDPLHDGEMNFTAYLRNQLVKNHIQRRERTVS